MTIAQDRRDAEVLLVELDTLQRCVLGLIEVCALIDAGLARFSHAQGATQLDDARMSSAGRPAAASAP